MASSSVYKEQGISWCKEKARRRNNTIIHLPSIPGHSFTLLSAANHGIKGERML